MDFFEKIGDKISSKGKDVAKIAKDRTDLVKLNSKLHDYEEMAKGIEQQIGKIYFSENRNNPAPQYMELFQQLINTYAALEKCKNDIYSLKGIHTCKSCGLNLQNNVLFCPNCGTKVNE